MSRCYCCNVILTTQEACAKFKNSGTYTEMCNGCLVASDLHGDVVHQQRVSTDEEEKLGTYYDDEDDESFDELNKD